MQACISYGRRHRDAPGFWLLATDYTPSVTSKHDLDAEILAAKFCLAPAGTGWGTRPPHDGHNPAHSGLQPQGRSPSPQPHASRLQPHALRLQPHAPRLQPRVSQPAAPRLQAAPHACRPRLTPPGRTSRLEVAAPRAPGCSPTLPGRTSRLEAAAPRVPARSPTPPGRTSSLQVGYACLPCDGPRLRACARAGRWRAPACRAGMRMRIACTVTTHCALHALHAHCTYTAWALYTIHA